MILAMPAGANALTYPRFDKSFWVCSVANPGTAGCVCSPPTSLIGTLSWAMANPQGGPRSQGRDDAPSD